MATGNFCLLAVASDKLQRTFIYTSQPPLRIKPHALDFSPRLLRKWPRENRNALSLKTTEHSIPLFMKLNI